MVHLIFVVHLYFYIFQGCTNWKRLQTKATVVRVLARSLLLLHKKKNHQHSWNIENIILTHSSERSPRCPRRRLVDPMFVFQITTDRWSTVLFNHHGNISQSGIERDMVPWALAYIVNGLILRFGELGWPMVSLSSSCSLSGLLCS